ncbi:hypothetical protein GOODEAATRI_030433 [Goodea atripinnis]|uniref:Uncharacterized protein n=1 Tax=Goodea atripinnis TaxID=208336 RepID=A0ABV0MN93_9TELE
MSINESLMLACFIHSKTNFGSEKDPQHDATTTMLLTAASGFGLESLTLALSNIHHQCCQTAQSFSFSLEGIWFFHMGSSKFQAHLKGNMKLFLRLSIHCVLTCFTFICW